MQHLRHIRGGAYESTAALVTHNTADKAAPTLKLTIETDFFDRIDSSISIGIRVERFLDQAYLGVYSSPKTSLTLDTAHRFGPI